MSEHAVQLLKGLCEIYSPSYREAPAVQFMVEQAAQMGMNAFVDGTGNFIAEKGSGTKTLLFLGHIDTVPGFIPVRVQDGVLYGRGAVDAKGPLAAFVSAVAQVRGLENLRIVIVGAVEEEAPTSKGARFILDKYQPDFVIIGEPSHLAGITIGYKGRLNVRCELVKQHQHTAAGGHGVASHGVAFWNRIRNYCEGFNQGKGSFETLDPYLLSFNTSSDGFSDKLEVQVSFRVPLGLSGDNFKDDLIRMADSLNLLEFYGIEEPFKANKNSQLVRAFLKALREKGLNPKFKIKTGTSDMNIVGPVWKCPILAYGPGDSKLDHTPQEHVSLQEYALSISVLTKVIECLNRE